MTYYLVLNPKNIRYMGITQPMAFGRQPAILVSYHYGGDGSWPKDAAARTWCRSWCLDSGAFTVWSKGTTIHLDDYIAFARDMWQADPTLDHVFTLDDIQSWQTTVRNTQRMWDAGIPVVPVYHVGEPRDLLVGYARDYPKISLGGMVPLRAQQKREFIDRCFQRIWPKAVHGLGVGSGLILAAPFHSVDASNWTAAARYGTWTAFGGKRLRVRKIYDMRIEIEEAIRREELARHRWGRELEPVRAALQEAGWRRP